MLSFLPQVVRTWRECDASSVSLGTFAVSATAFGALQGSWPIIVSNAVCLMLVLTIVALCLKFSDDA
jgi:MtN3 and saliva related transmembrane protein